MNLMSHRAKKVLFTFSLSLGLMLSTSLQAETVECIEITSLPWVITTQGVFCLKGKLSTNISSGSAIDIQTNNVTIDFNGFKLGGLAAGPATSATGVVALERKNITLRNGNIRGFLRGIYFSSSDSDYTNDGGHLLENNRLDGNTFTGIWVEGSNNTVQGNLIRNTGGGTSVTNGLGILTKGPGVRIIDNDIDKTIAQTATGDAIGIDILFASDSAIIKGNRISRTEHDTGGVSYGIYRGNGVRVLIKDNDIVNDTMGTTAIRGGTTTDSFCRNNNMVNFTTGLDNCHDGGGNVTN